MTAVTASTIDDRDRSALGNLARKEIVRYARHPVFLVGLAVTLLSMWGPPDGLVSSLGNVIVPAAGIGVFGLIVMASLVRSSDRAAEAAGAVATGQRTRTLALVAALVVPATVGLAWFAWAVWAFHRWPAPPNGAPFGGIGDGWAYAVLFDLGVLACIGGPVLGLVLGRWVNRRGAAPIAVVLLVLATIVMQGIFEPLRTIRLIMPWTQFTGQFGIEGDPNRIAILTGSPHWYGVYLALLCSAGVLVALLRDDERPRGRLIVALAAVGVAAAVACVLAVTGGVQETMFNPLPSGVS
ncbi:MAG: hypothetical protein GEU74_15625 [Nitriliruptorales bacterium]|nr:hypothetical protein [Nitriliruptorales bacterium]